MMKISGNIYKKKKKTKGFAHHQMKQLYKLLINDVKVSVGQLLNTGNLILLSNGSKYVAKF